MPDELNKPYDPKEHEDKIYRIWEESGYFNPDKLPTTNHKPKTKSFAIVLAPPNVTGSLHMGHALEHTASDILVRFKRMQGYKTLWLPGTDHAGIATQNAVEKELKKQGISRNDLGREKFLGKVWEWKEKYGNIILDQMKKLGASCDWSRTRFTMDAKYQEAVKTAFLHYQKKGLIYRGERTVNWCPRCGTSLSDLEIEHKEEKGSLYYIKYGPLVLATARPETKLGDTALAVNPKDKRYKNLVGKEIAIQSVDSTVPRQEPPRLKEIRIKVIADQAADPKFGTGVIKVTPAHDLTDFEIYTRHQEIPIKAVIEERGRMNENAGTRYFGLKTAEARKQIVEDMQKLELIEKIESYAHNLAVCYRCGTILEPILSKQWFLKMETLARMAARAVKNKKVILHPKRWEKVYFDWLKDIKDWCISRQIWWGHKIPIDGEDDVLDTWFSSALWPFAVFGWPRDFARGKPKKENGLEKFYPTNTLTNDRGIINLWDARMVFSALEFTGQAPFKDLLIHATILTKDGKRMSKSLGTGIDPIDLINKYGADATRFGLIWQAMGSQDIRWSEEHVAAGKKFCNKIWNASRFVLAQIGNLKQIQNLKLETEESNPTPPAPSPRGRGLGEGLIPHAKSAHDKKILAELKLTQNQVSKLIEKYEFGQALHLLYDFFWHKYCDIYIEKSKQELNAEVLAYVLAESLKTLHPFMPFITERLWSYLKPNQLLIIERWTS